MDKPAIAYCGFVDKQNIGDYAVYCANRALFPDFCFLPGLKMNQLNTDVNLFGGCTLYPFFLGGKVTKRRKLNVAIGLGVDDPDFYGGFGVRARWEMWKWRFAFLGVRGTRSKEILSLFGIDSVVTGDTALYLRPSRHISHVSQTVAVNLVGEEMERLGDRERIFTEMLQVCSWLISNGRRILLVPMCRADLPWTQRFLEALRARSNPGSIELFNPWSDAIDCNVVCILNELAQCELLIGERLHSTVLAAAAGVPFVSLAYKSKCVDFVQSLGVDSWAQSLETCSAKTILQQVEDLLSDNRSCRESLGERVGQLRITISEAALKIRELVSRGSAAASQGEQRTETSRDNRAK